MDTLTISPAVLRQFIAGKQGLYPGRRWRGKARVAQAIRAGSVVQVDPLNVVARSHDIALYGRVLDYEPALLNTLLYQDRAFFDYGGVVMIHPVEELPYWRVVMARKQNEPRRVAFAEAHPQAIETVRATVRERGALGTRDLGGARVVEGSFRSGKDTGQAFYYLWMTGELMTHSRRGFDRIYDLRQRIAPAALNYAASPDEADEFFARMVLREIGITTARGWRSWFASLAERKVTPDEAAGRLQSMMAAGEIATLQLEGDAKTHRYVAADDLPLLNALLFGEIPDEWQPLETSTSDEMVFLAPLEIVSTRGRAKPLFKFDYLWEVYKPEAKRRWGYYTLPILYGDRLVARLDPKLERATNTLVVKGFWLEDHAVVDEAFLSALAAGFRRFMAFVGAESLDLGGVSDMRVRDGVTGRM